MNDEDVIFESRWNNNDQPKEVRKNDTKKIHNK